MKLLLCILDGVGIREEVRGNAVYKANMPNFKRLLNEYPNCLLEACGKKVGLPEGQMGNSEVGHTNIGAGRIVYQPLELINSKIESKEFFDNKNILEVISHTKKNKSKLHIMGLLSDGGIHSHINHLFALLEMCKKENIEEVYLHMFLDGRDTLPKEGLKYLDLLNKKIKELGIGKICTISGRYYAMDRDNNYDRVKLAYDAIVNGKGETYNTYKAAIKANLSKNIMDEFTIPCVINEGKVSNKDGVIFFNFRPDRLRELGASLTNPKFDGFKTKKLDIKLVTMMPVSDEVINKTAFDNQNLEDTFGEYISKKGLTQLRIAETEKYAHVTYFFDGGVEKKLKGAKRKLIPSPKVATYDLKPEMSAYKITTALLKEMHKYDVIILNFANGDMVGHTGNMDATVKALEDVDVCLGKIYNKVMELGGTLIVTADHGNSDYMEDDKGNIITSHSMSKVPFIITKDNIKLKDGKLGDIAPTMLTLLDLPIPSSMTGEVLIQNKIKKKSNKFEKIFRIFSLIFIIFSVTYFSARFIYFYSITHTKIKYQEANILEKLEDNILEDCTNYKCFKGDILNNYLYFKGIMWRILGYDDDNIKLISDESLTSLRYSNIDSWLEEFRNKINKDEFIKEISVLTKEDYLDTFTDSSYLNNYSFWFLKNDEVVTKSGEVKGNVYGYNGVRPVISISKDTIIVSGNGNMNNPYQITSSNPQIIKDADLGSYVKYSNYIWRIIDINDIGVKISLAGVLDEHVYSKNNLVFDINDVDSIAYYLNNDFYNSLNKNGILNAKWKVNRYDANNNFNYNDIIKEFDAYVGLLNIGDLFINDKYDYTLLTETSDNKTYKVNPYNLLFLDLKNSKRKIRPAIYLKSDLLIKKGSGKALEPFELEV